MNATEITQFDSNPIQTASQRALAAARQGRQFSADARTRQTAGIRAPEGTKGKSAAKAAVLFGVSTRAVELALFVLDRGIPALVQAMEADKIRLAAAAKVARLSADSQGKVVAHIVAGRPLANALAAVQPSALGNATPIAGPDALHGTPTPAGAATVTPATTAPSPEVASRICGMCGTAQALPGERHCDNCQRILICIDASYAAAFYRRRAGLGPRG